MWLLRRLERSLREWCGDQKRAAHLSVVLRSQIQESEVIRQTPAIEYICPATPSNRDFAVLKPGLLTLQVFRKPSLSSCK
ncbi:hypothetical protein [Microcoleus sp. LEGE 07076]|uniref:hypothetical protein n=1 Tax=Microcoleus sp. LEGE 07076 TaxID=915322 RepID=UPI00187F2BCB|nr:hypothetical protein [Microcoleus sp. LEGE 07076]